MPESGWHDLFNTGVKSPVITGADLAIAFRWWLRGLAQHPHVGEAKRITTLIRHYVQVFEEDELAIVKDAIPEGGLFDGLREVIRREEERRELNGGR